VAYFGLLKTTEATGYEAVDCYGIGTWLHMLHWCSAVPRWRRRRMRMGPNRGPIMNAAPSATTNGLAPHAGKTLLGWMNCASLQIHRIFLCLSTSLDHADCPHYMVYHCITRTAQFLFLFLKSYNRQKYDKFMDPAY
jgi:hypothetical protein